MPAVGASARAVARGFTYVEDVVYVGLGVLLAGAAITLMIVAPVVSLMLLRRRATPAVAPRS